MEKLTNKKIINTTYVKVTKEKGITLIALVITVIVLLILAGVTIATLTGDNGIITRATTAKEKTNIGGEKDLLALAYNSAVSGNYGNGEITDEQLQKELDNQGVNAKVTKNSPLKVTFNDSGNSYTIDEKTGEIIGPTTEEKLAEDILKTNQNENEDYKKSPYVKYNDIICRVLYNDNEHGLQIITAENVEEKFTLGKSNDFEQSKTDYNDLVDKLNGEAKKYMNSGDGIATDARSLGSIATLTEGGKFQGDTTTEKNYKNNVYEYLLKYNNQFKPGDNNYKEDVAQLKALGLNVSSTTWLASRNVDAGSSVTGFYVRYVVSNGYTASYSLCNVYSGGSTRGYSLSYGFRPVFLLSSNVKIKGDGDGTEEKPYELEI